jgi:hypothetical protein
LQSPYGDKDLRQHPLLNLVLHSTAGGGIYEKSELSTGNLWISGVKTPVYADRCMLFSMLQIRKALKKAVLLVQKGFQAAPSASPDRAILQPRNDLRKTERSPSEGAGIASSSTV